MSFPTELSNAIDGVTEVVAAHLNNLEAKVGINNSAVATSLDYLLKNAASIDPGHKHTAGALSGGNNGDVFYKAAGAWGPGTPDAAGLVAKSGDQSIAGVKTFTSIPLGPGSNPATDNQLARKAYVDLMLPLAGGTMAGNIAMNNHKVTGLAAASGAGEALRYDEWIAAQDPGHKHSKLWASDGSPEAMTVDATGKVGIGTTTPGAKLSVYDSDTGRINMSGPTFDLQSDNGSGTPFIVNLTGTASLIANFQDSGTSVLAIKNGGNVGIGNPSPGYLLEMENSGGGYYSSSDHAWHNGSSIRWKESPVPIAQALDLVKQLTGVRFNWKDSGIPGIGLIAEDVLKIVPEVVSVDKENPEFCNGISYGSMIGLLIEAIKDQQFQIESIIAKLN